MFCTNCGAKLNVGDNFCSSCGCLTSLIKRNYEINSINNNGINPANSDVKYISKDIPTKIMSMSTIGYIIFFAIYVTMSYGIYMAVEEYIELFKFVEYTGVHSTSEIEDGMAMEYILLSLPFLLLGLMILFFRKNPLFILTNITAFLVLFHAIISHSSMRSSKKAINNLVEAGYSYPLPTIYTGLISLYLILAVIGVYLILRTSPKIGHSVKKNENGIFGFLKR